MHIDPRRLPVLLAVRREGGIVAAADVLGVSPSAVSQQVQRLEDEVGLELIERTPTGAVLTPAGHVLAGGAERIEAELTDTTQALRPFTGQVTGVVTIGSFQTLLRAVLIPFLADLAHVLPGIELRLVETDEIPGMAALRSGRFDILTLERDESPGGAPRGFTDTAFFDEPWVLATPTAAPPIGSERDLAPLHWLRVLPGTAGAHAMARITAGIPEPEFAEDSYINYGVALSLVTAGRGSTVLPRLALVDVPLEGVRVTPLPGLGVRRLLIRHRTHAADPATPGGQVIQRLVQWVADHPFSEGVPA